MTLLHRDSAQYALIVFGLTLGVALLGNGIVALANWSIGS